MRRTWTIIGVGDVPDTSGGTNRYLACRRRLPPMTTWGNPRRASRCLSTVPDPPLNADVPHARLRPRSGPPVSPPVNRARRRASPTAE
jgi:hypothetical protein